MKKEIIKLQKENDFLRQRENKLQMIEQMYENGTVDLKDLSMLLKREMKAAKQKKLMQQRKNKDLPIATEIIRDLKRSKKRLFTIIIILLVMVFAGTVYTVLLLDSLNTSVGVITEEVSHLD